MSSVSTWINNREHRVPFDCPGYILLNRVGGERLFMGTTRGLIEVDSRLNYDVQGMSLYTFPDAA